MARRLRVDRGAGWQTIFHTEEDYAAFQKILEEGHARFGMRLLGYCLMPNHWHLVVWPGGNRV